MERNKSRTLFVRTLTANISELFHSTGKLAICVREKNAEKGLKNLNKKLSGATMSNIFIPNNNIMQYVEIVCGKVEQ